MWHVRPAHKCRGTLVYMRYSNKEQQPLCMPGNRVLAPYVATKSTLPGQHVCAHPRPSPAQSARGAHQRVALWGG